MEANVKLLKKKRIAHMCGKMSKSNLDEPKLPPDDFVYNIMKDMDSNNIISYKQSQEIKHKKRRDVSLNEGERQMKSTTQDDYNKQAKKVLPKKSFPLMRKCQTSLKYLEKNRCIPKPRAHVGFVPKPQVKPVSYAEQKSSKSEYENLSKVVKTKKVQSKAYSKILQSNYLKNKISVPSSYKKNESSSSAAQEVGCHLNSTDDDDASQEVDHLSNTDDDDAAFESFVQKAIEDQDSTDSDSRLIIHRKKSKHKSKQKKKRHRSKSFSDDENNKPITKITSIPLSDSSESESKDTFEEINKSLKRKTDSLNDVQKRVCKGALVPYNSESSSDPPSDQPDDNYCSSDEDFSVHASTLSNGTEKVASNVNIDVSNVNPESYEKLSIHDTEHRLNHNSSSDPAVLNSVGSEVTNDADTSDANSLLPCYSDITKNVPKYQVSCYVKLKRDPTLDKRALTFCTTTASSEDDCIIISENDIDEVSATSHSTSSSAIETVTPLGLSRDALNKGLEIPNLISTNSQSCEDTEIDDCVIMCEMPKEVLKNNIEANIEKESLSSESLSSTTKSTSTNSNIQDLQTTTMAGFVNTCENTKPDAVYETSEVNNEQLLNSDKTADCVPFCHEDESNDEFKVQIVAVQSLVESSSNPFEANAAELDEIEVIDLSDDDLMENENSEVVKEISMKDHSEISVQDEKAIQPNLTENNISEHKNKTYDTATLLSEHHIQKICENSTAKEHNLPDPKIIEILNTINFDCIKEVINKTKLVDTIRRSSEVETSTSDCVLPTLPGPTTIHQNKVEAAIFTNIQGFEKCSSNMDENMVDKIQEIYELNNDAEPINVSCKTLKRKDAVVELPDNTTKSSCISSSKNAMGSHSKISNYNTINLSSDEDKTALVTDMNIKPTSNNSCTVKENISSETSLQSKTFQMALAEERTVHNGDQGNEALYKQTSENSLSNFTKRNAGYSDTAICNGSKSTEVPNKERQPNYQTPTEAIPRITKISREMYTTVPDTRNPLKHKVVCAKYEKVNIKCEIPESPLDDLDVIASTYIQDLNPPNKKVLPLLNLYKAEYAKYMQIKNTEVNVSAGLKLLHENQVKKLVHLRSSIKNLVKHDTCFYKVAQENCMETKANIMKSAVKYKVEVKTFSSPASSSEERGSTMHEKDTKPSLKIDSATTSREKLLKLMMDIKCAQCGKPATARCQGCAEVFYCSRICGELSWKQGHNAVCKR